MCFEGIIRLRKHGFGGAILVEDEYDVEPRWRREGSIKQVYLYTFCLLGLL